MPRCAAGRRRLAVFQGGKGRVRKRTFSPAPVVAAERLYLVTVSGLDAFRAVYEALPTTWFYNLSPAAIRNLQPPDQGILLKQDSSDVAGVLSNLAAHSLENMHRIEAYLS